MERVLTYSTEGPSDMSTYLDVSKAAQEQILATIKQGQELTIAGVELWAASVAPLSKGEQFAMPFEAPAPKDVVANTFGFTEKLLASQKAFAEKIVAATAPVVTASTPKK
jgi:hypothetical protein